MKEKNWLIRCKQFLLLIFTLLSLASVMPAQATYPVGTYPYKESFEEQRFKGLVFFEIDKTPYMYPNVINAYKPYFPHGFLWEPITVGITDRANAGLSILNDDWKFGAATDGKHMLGIHAQVYPAPLLFYKLILPLTEDATYNISFDVAKPTTNSSKFGCFPLKVDVLNVFLVAVETRDFGLVCNNDMQKKKMQFHAAYGQQYYLEFSSSQATVANATSLVMDNILVEKAPNICKLPKSSSISSRTFVIEHYPYIEDFENYNAALKYNTYKGLLFNHIDKTPYMGNNDLISFWKPAFVNGFLWEAFTVGITDKAGTELKVLNNNWSVGKPSSGSHMFALNAKAYPFPLLFYKLILPITNKATYNVSFDIAKPTASTSYSCFPLRVDIVNAGLQVVKSKDFGRVCNNEMARLSFDFDANAGSQYYLEFMSSGVTTGSGDDLLMDNIVVDEKNECIIETSIITEKFEDQSGALLPASVEFTPTTANPNYQDIVKGTDYAKTRPLAKDYTYLGYKIDSGTLNTTATASILSVTGAHIVEFIYKKNAAPIYTITESFVDESGTLIDAALLPSGTLNPNPVTAASGSLYSKTAPTITGYVFNRIDLSDLNGVVSGNVVTINPVTGNTTVTFVYTQKSVNPCVNINESYLVRLDPGNTLGRAPTSTPWCKNLSEDYQLSPASPIEYNGQTFTLVSVRINGNSVSAPYIIKHPVTIDQNIIYTYFTFGFFSYDLPANPKIMRNFTVSYQNEAGVEIASYSRELADQGSVNVLAPKLQGYALSNYFIQDGKTVTNMNGGNLAPFTRVDRNHDLIFVYGLMSAQAASTNNGTPEYKVIKTQ